MLMMRRFTLACSLYLLFLLCAQPVGASEEGMKSRPADPSVLDSLRRGGYILYVRHGDASIGEDLPNLDFNDCSTQRNLSETGQEQAVKFGETLRALQIPVQAPVRTSPFCRTRETAELAFGQDKVQSEPVWLNVYRLNATMPPTEQQAILKDVDAALEVVPSPGYNEIVVAHSFPRGVGLGEVPYLGTVIVKPKGQGQGYDVAGRFTLEELSSLRQLYLRSAVRR